MDKVLSGEIYLHTDMDKIVCTLPLHEENPTMDTKNICKF